MMVFGGHYFFSETDCGEKRCLVIYDIDTKTRETLDIEINYGIEFKHDSYLIVVDQVDSPERPWNDKELNTYYIPERYYVWDEEKREFYQLTN
jgi:hypothetical protein